MCGLWRNTHKDLSVSFILDNTDARILLLSKMKETMKQSSVRLSLFPCQGSSVNDAQNANTIGKLSTYLKTRGGLCRLLMLFPGETPVTEALRNAPSVLTNSRKEVAL